jgi:lipid-A-disaccharide synthase
MTGTQTLPHRLVAVTGEASGDLIAADALARVIAANPGVEVGGIGGERLKNIGMDCWFSSDDLAVRGYVEALSKIVHILSVRYWLLEYIDKWTPGVFLGVDAPDFNLGVETRVRAKGVRTVHLISPSIWAWRPERILKIQKAVDHMLCIFPFEPVLYQGTGVQATYVGHPIADLIPMVPDQSAARQRLGLSGNRPVIAVLPGSRAGEIRHNGDAFFGAAAQLAARCDVIVPVSSAPMAARIEKHTAFARAKEAGVRLLAQDSGAAPISHTAMAACDVALVASGTATLETALFKKPMVIAYRVPGLTYSLMKRRALIRDIGLPNILLGHRAVPELIQNDVTADNLCREVLQWCDAPARVAELAEEFSRLHVQLRQGAAQRIADILSSELSRATHGGMGV